MMFFIDLTTISFSDVFANKDRVAPTINLTNVPTLNYLLRSEIFINEDGQLRAAHLILDYMSLSRIFQDAGQAIRAGSSRLTRIDVSQLGFLAHTDLPPVELPIQRAAQEVVVLRKETASVQLSLEAKIDQFRLEDEGVPERPVELSDFVTEFDRF